jgi:hypothetical protein
MQLPLRPSEGVLTVLDRLRGKITGAPALGPPAVGEAAGGRTSAPPTGVALAVSYALATELCLLGLGSRQGPSPGIDGSARPTTSAHYRPDVGGVGPNQATIQSQTTPARARFWLKRIDRRIAYANSVVDE